MSQPLANYTFYSWLRRGVATEIASVGEPNTSAQGSSISRATFPISLEFGMGQSAGIDLTLYGPGDVRGIDSRMIIREYPLSDVYDAESNYFPAIEFDQPDFPWRYTPVAPNEHDRLRPWLVLIVLTDDEVVESPEPAKPQDGRLPEITPSRTAPLPNLEQSWAWSHVQLTGLDDEEMEEDAIRQIIENEPHLALSRLVCPRRLKPRTTYTAYLVPAFKQGLLTGLGDDIAGVPASDLAWLPGNPPDRIPFYFKWRFGTGVAGDFESLVRQLRARTLPSGIGIRGMDVSSPLPGSDPVFPSAADSPMGLEGALMSPASEEEREKWPDPETAFVDQLASRLNRPADLLAEGSSDPLVAPPLYAQWHAAQDRVDSTTSGWFSNLNVDPRWRTVAGLGTQVVQDQQQQLMASAWEQVEGVLEINERMKRAQMGREILKRMYKKHLEPLATETFLTVTATLHPRVVSEQVTVQHLFKNSKVAEGTLDPQFQKIARPLGPIGRHQGRPHLAAVPTVLTQMNQGQITTPSFPTEAFGDASPDSPRGQPFIRPTVTGAEVRRIRIPAGRRPIFNVRDEPLLAFLTFPDSQGNFDVATSERFRDAFADLLDARSTPSVSPAVPASLNLETLKERIADRIDPEKTMQTRFKIGARLEIAPWVRWEPADLLEPVMAAPEFDQPMYEPLRDLSQEWLLPGVGQIPPNTVSTLVTNPQFVESFLVGLNHEMARELLWQEYPTDQRGTYFRQFWDVLGFNELPGSKPDSFKDIHPLHSKKWNISTPLGVHSARDVPPTNKQLVLVIRGEVLRRYPGTSIYAVKAGVDRTGKRTLGKEYRYPMFHGTLKPDLSFFGFNLTVEAARGKSNGQGQDEGWFFVLEEPLTELRFGLDVRRNNREEPLTQWEDLSWEDLVERPENVNHLEYIKLEDSNFPNVENIEVPRGEEPPLAWHDDSRGAPNGGARPRAKASDLAYITMQKPFRVAVHGSDMLIEEGASRSPFHA